MQRERVSDIFRIMDDPRWLKLITIGLVLASLAVGYFLFSGRLSSTQPTPSPSVLGENIKSSPVPAPASAYERIVNRTRDGVQVLPRTGFPYGLAVVFSASAIISGWSLRKFPN